MIPDHIKRGITTKRSALAIVREAIARKQITTDFLVAWARLFTLNGVVEFLELGQANDTNVERALSGLRTTGTELQQFWFAHWIKVRAFSLSAKHRRREGKNLAKLCLDIENGAIEPWGPYPAQWYSVLLEPKTKNDLRESYYKLGEPKLRSMLKHTWITPAVLPPLNISNFKPITR